jgi:hypothetical protein
MRCLIIRCGYVLSLSNSFHAYPTTDEQHATSCLRLHLVDVLDTLESLCTVSAPSSSREGESKPIIFTSILGELVRLGERGLLSHSCRSTYEQDRTCPLSQQRNKATSIQLSAIIVAGPSDIITGINRISVRTKQLASEPCDTDALCIQATPVAKHLRQATRIDIGTSLYNVVSSTKTIASLCYVGSRQI